MKEQYPATSHFVNALHAPSWHAQCPSVAAVDIGGRAHLWCPDCRCLVSMEAVAAKVDINSTFTAAQEVPL